MWDWEKILKMKGDSLTWTSRNQIVLSQQSTVCSQDDFYESIFIFVHNPPPAGYIFVEKFKNAIKNSLGVQCFFESMKRFNKTTSINVCTTIFFQLLQEY
ncbi:MAG: hypothetical protein AUJ54_01990 [Ignavibacteria bacterium CG1_02_37_35]|nr:MAG: hypothetical protein AUJ54_01990 [Ignavibacteria bacterium CG1_02_37_35]